MDSKSSVSEIGRVSLLLKEVKLGDASAQEGLLKLYEELKECYDGQESSAPASEYAGDQDEELKQLCTQASLLFVARVLFGIEAQEHRLSPNFGFPISRIVAAAGINLLDFFREVNVVVSKLSAYFEARGSSSRLFTQLAQLKENSETVVVMGLLAKKYKDTFNMFMHQLDFYKQVVLKLGWSAFLVLRVKLLSSFPDIVSCVELLPCVFAVLTSHAPRLPDCLRHLSLEDGKPALLKAVSETCKAEYNRVQARMPSVIALLTQILTSAVPEWRAAISNAALRAQQADLTARASLTFAGVVDLVSYPVLDGLVTDADRMERALSALEAVYEQHYTQSGTELDEREFLYTDFTKFASPRFSPGHMHAAVTKLRAGPSPLRQGALLGPGAHTTAPSVTSPCLISVQTTIPAGLHSPIPMLNLGATLGHPNTPVSEILNASAWLRSVTSNLAIEPSAGLMRYLDAVAVPSAGSSSARMIGSSSPAQQLGQRVRDLVSLIMPEEKIPSLLAPFPLLQPSLVEERRTQVTKLYYLSLEVILQTEEKASGMAGVTSLLLAGKFHRALVACCVEVVAACYRMVSCAFPKVLDALRIKAFDFAKMIEGFVKSIATLPRELKRHFFLIEEKILESLAWEAGSPLYDHMYNVADRDEMATSETITDTQMLKVEIATLATMSSVNASVPPPSPKRAQTFKVVGISPSKKARGMDGSSQPLQPGKLPSCIGTKPLASPDPSGSTEALYDFCRKVLKLAAFRLAVMCDNFDFSPLNRADVNAKVYEIIEYALYNQTHLFYNRHLDQVILSALYGYCKVHKLSQVSFREIIAHYRKQPQAQPSIFRSVIIEQSNPALQVFRRADIIAFYNQVFVPAMKSYLLKSEFMDGSTGPSVPIMNDIKPGDGNSDCNESVPATQGWMSSNPVSTLTQSWNPLRTSQQLELNVSNSRLRGDEGQRLHAVMGGLGAYTHVGSGAVASEQMLTEQQDNKGYKGSLNVVSSLKKMSSCTELDDIADLHSKSGATLAQQIPDGLAALLQALDSQQGVVQDCSSDMVIHEGQSGKKGCLRHTIGLMPCSSGSVPWEHIGEEQKNLHRPEYEDEGGMEGPERAHIQLIGRRLRTPNRKYGNI
nr:retinoblastoma-like protein [Volvox reticuliferus]